MLNLRVFISSPGDVSDERQLARRAMERVALEAEFWGRVRFEPVSWDAPGGDVENGGEIDTIQTLDSSGFTRGILLIASDGRTVATGIELTTIWSFDHHLDKMPLAQAPSESSILAISPGGSVAAAADGNTVHLWDVATGYPLPDLVGHSDRVSSLDFSPDGSRLLSGSSDGTARLWSLGTGETLAVFSGHEAPVQEVRMLPDARRAVSSDSKGVVILWDLERAESLDRLHEADGDPAQDLAVSDDGRWAAWGHKTGNARAVDLETRRVTELDPPANIGTLGVSSVGIAPGGRYALGKTDMERFVVWDLGTGKVVLEAVTGQGIAIQRNPKITRRGRIAFTGSYGKDGIRIWEVEGGGPLKFDPPPVLKADAEANRADFAWSAAGYVGGSWTIQHAAFSADGRTVPAVPWLESVSILDYGRPLRLRELLGKDAAADWHAAHGYWDRAVELGGASALKRARWFLRAGRDEEARGAYESALGSGEAPEHYLKLCLRGFGTERLKYLRHLQRGRELAREGRRAEAIDELTRALQLNAALKKVHVERGMLREAEGDTEGALADYEAGDSTYVDSLPRRLTGDLHFRAGDLAAAEKAYKHALGANSRDGRALAGLGRVMALLGNHNGAVDHLTRAISLGVTSPEMYIARGRSRLALGDAAAALSDFEEVMRLQPDRLDARLGRAAVRLHQGYLGGAIEDAAEALRLDAESAEAYRIRGEALKQQGHPGAQKDLDKAADLLFQEGYDASVEGKDDEAIASFKRVLKITPRHGVSLYNVGFLSQRQGRWDEAIAYLTEAIAEGFRPALSYYYRGLAWEKKQQRREARSDYDEARKLDPEDADAHARSGYMSVQLEEYEIAVEPLTAAIEAKPDAYWPYNLRGVVNLETGRLEAALADLTECIKLNPRYSWAYLNRARVHEKAGRPEEAVRDYRSALEREDEKWFEREEILERLEALEKE